MTSSANATEINALLLEKIELLQETVARLEAALKWAEAKYAALERRVYGASSERVTREDLSQFLPRIAEVEGDIYSVPKVESITIERKKQHLEQSGGIRSEIPEHLERRRVEVPAPLAVIENPEGWVRIGEEVSKRLNLEPGKLYCEEIVVGKYKSLEETNKIVQTPVPATIGEKCLASPELGAHIVLQKFDLHVPYYRQRKYFKEAFGVKLHESTFDSWGNLTLELLVPLANRVKEQVLSSNYIQIDETPIKTMDPEVKGRCATGQLFAYSIPKKEIFFDWQMSRGHESVYENLKGFDGTAQSDGFSIYEMLAGKRPDLIFMGCWAHARRKFFTAMEQGEVPAGWYVERIGKLYKIEEDLREAQAPPEERLRVRQLESLPVLDEIFKKLEIDQQKALNQTHYGRALHYAYRQWDKLVIYATDGRYEIDNNFVENAIRPSAIGKKNWLFVGSPDVGHRHAAIYTMIGSCRRLGINPHEYIPSVVKELCGLKVKGLQELDRLTPREWKKRQITAPCQ